LFLKFENQTNTPQMTSNLVIKVRLIIKNTPFYFIGHLEYRIVNVIHGLKWSML